MAIKVANNNSLSAITALPAAITGGAMTLLETQTASSSSTISFTSNIDNTYKEYVFRFYNIHPATDTADFFVKFRDGGSSYDATITTTVFRAYHTEADSTAFEYETSEDVAQGTSGQGIAYNIGADNDQGVSGFLHLYDPSNTTFVKHFICRMQNAHGSDLALDNYVAGYCNVTAAIDGVQFSMDTGAIESGVIKLYGIS